MKHYKEAVFAGGCFWCMVKPFDTLDGIEEVISGYTGGHIPNPTYEQVKSGTTGHTEAVKIIYDPELFSYEALLDIYWRQTDPTDAGGQFIDRGDSYRPVIFYQTDDEKRLAEASKQALQNSGRFDRPIVTQIEPAGAFYEAEAHHQQYYKHHTTAYESEQTQSGRQAFIQKHWQSSQNDDSTS